MKTQRCFVNFYNNLGSIENIIRTADLLNLILHLSFGDGVNQACLNYLIKPEAKPWSNIRNKSDLNKLTSILASTFAIRVTEDEDGCIMATVLDGTPAFLDLAKALGKKHAIMSVQEVDDYYTGPSYPNK